MASIFRELPIDQVISQIENEQRTRYAGYALKRNPFPLGGNFPEGYLRYTYLEERQRALLDDFLVTTFIRGEFNGLLILGEYGSGKSHLLNYVYETINIDTRGIFEGRALAFLIQNPSVSPEDILLSLLRTIGLGTIQDLIFLPIRRALRKEYGDNLLPFLRAFTNFTGQMNVLSDSTHNQSYQPAWFIDLFSKGYREFRHLLKAQNVILKPKEMKLFAQQTLAAEVSDNPLIVEGLLALVFDDETKDASSWESFLVRNLKRGQAVGVEYYLGAFLRLFEIMGIRHVYLLVDELEDLRTQRLSKKAATEYLAALRRMIQHNYRLFSFVLASTRDAWNELKLLYPAIEDRFPVRADLIRNPADVKRVVATYLQKARIDKYEGSDWFPFDETAVDRVIQLRGTVLRHVITECRKLLDVGANQKTEPPFSAKFVEDNIPVSAD